LGQVDRKRVKLYDGYSFRIRYGVNMTIGRGSFGGTIGREQNNRGSILLSD